MQTWVAEWGPLVTLASTVVLLGVTAWYAWLTKRVADASRDAAVHAKIAAQASLASVSAAEAAIPVTFRLEPASSGTAGGLRKLLEKATKTGNIENDQPVTQEMLASFMRLNEVGLVCEGSTVYVHGCQLDTLSVPQNEDGSHIATETVQAPLEPGDSSPRRLHKGESMTFRIPERPTGERVTAMSCTISYSFDGTQGRFERKVHWRENKESSGREIGVIDMTKRSAEPNN